MAHELQQKVESAVLYAQMVLRQEPLINSGQSRLPLRMFRIKARIAGNSQLLPTTAGMQEVGQRREQLPRFATQKLDILGARYEFTN
jgi:hypothetical protein